MSERVEVFKDKSSEFRWRHLATNENIVSESGESYVRLIDAVRMAKQENPGVPVFQIEQDDDGKVTPDA